MRRARRKISQNGPLDRDRAFEILFREKTFASVWHWLDRLGVPLRDRRDVAQEVFLAAHQSFHTYDPMRSRPERWLNKITVHIAAHYRDRAQHRREELTPEEFFDVVDENPGPDEQIRQEEERLEVLDLLQTLDVDLRSVLIAHDIDGIPMQEIAEQHGIPLSTAYKWRARALVAFQEAIEQRRREEEERIGGGGMVVLPLLDAVDMLAWARPALAGLEQARLSVLEGVVQALEQLRTAAGAGAGGRWARLEQVAPSVSGRAALRVASAAMGALAALGILSGLPLAPRVDAAPGPVLAAAITPASFERLAEPAAQAAAAPGAAAPQALAAPARPAPAAQPPQGGAARVAAKPATQPALRPLDRDLALFDACQNALRRGDADRAERCLDDYAREVPRSRFDQEVQVMRVRVLLLRGDTEGARLRAERLVAAFPAAARRPEIQAILGQQP